MPQPPRKETPLWEQKVTNPGTLLLSAVTIYSGIFTPVLHRGFGYRAFTLYPLTLVFMIWYAFAAPCLPLIFYIPVWLMLIIAHRLTHDRTRHSRYMGYPWLICLLPLVNEYRGRFLEPFALFAIGLLLCRSAPTLCFLLAGGCLAMFMGFAAENMVIQQRKRQLHDQLCEAAHWADLSRGGSGWD